MLGSTTDLLRLLAVPFFGYVAYRDVETRRVPNRTWYPLAALAVVVLLWDAAGAYAAGDTLFFVRVAISLGFLIPLVTAFWYIGGFGGADAKAFYVVALLFPTVPTYYLPTVALPLEVTTIGVFSMTILSNTVVVGAAYPLGVALTNLLRGRFAWPMLIGKPVAVADVVEEYGVLLETPEGYTRQGLDLDALRMYLAWRDCTLAELRADPQRHRDPASLPADPERPGDGAIATDGGVSGDAWGAEAFLADIDHGAYGTTPEDLRAGLTVLTTQDEVWISPGIPFLVPLFGGLLVSLTYGDLLFSLVDLL